VASVEESHTGRFLAEVLEPVAQPVKRRAVKQRVPA